MIGANGNEHMLKSLCRKSVWADDSIIAEDVSCNRSFDYF
jgi:hypothetical protein